MTPKPPHLDAICRSTFKPRQCQWHQQQVRDARPIRLDVRREENFGDGQGPEASSQGVLLIRAQEKKFPDEAKAGEENGRSSGEVGLHDRVAERRLKKGEAIGAPSSAIRDHRHEWRTVASATPATAAQRDRYVSAVASR